VTAPIISIVANYVNSYTDASGNLWDSVNLVIQTGAGYGTQPTIPISVDGITYLNISRPISTTFTYNIGVSGKAGGSVYVICADTTHCTNYTSAIVYAASNGTTPIGTVACVVSANQLVTIAGWNGSKYQTHIAGTGSGSDIFYYPNNIKLGPCA
jgi:hypothetical protein